MSNLAALARAPILRKRWKPRASSIGNYMACTWRAAQDRLVHEGALPAPMEREGPGNSDLGTCGHFTLQDGLQCTFPQQTLVNDPAAFGLSLDQADAMGEDPGPFTENEQRLLSVACEHFEGDLVSCHEAFQRGDSRCYQPTKNDWAMASKLWKGNLDITRERVRATATLAAGRVPTLPPGQVWRAEDAFELPFVTGHTDFLSPDRKVVGDLKTTAKPPRGGWIKYEHLPQLTCYHLMTGAERAWVLYVDSMRAAWVNIVWIDFTTDAMKFYADQVRSFCEYLMSDRLMENTYPALGDHCTKTWCRHVADCHAMFVPAPGRMYQIKAARKSTGPVKLAPIRM